MSGPECELNLLWLGAALLVGAWVGVFVGVLAVAMCRMAGGDGRRP
jgi:hypothetical protein